VNDCIIDDAKVRDYLLNLDHADGGPKALFFLGGGFSVDKLEQFKAALRRHLRDNPVTRREADRFGGERLVIDAPMSVPDGRTPIVRTVWTIDEGETLPRLITAYPID
jgi:hypothetical protein